MAWDRHFNKIYQITTIFSGNQRRLTIIDLLRCFYIANQTKRLVDKYAQNMAELRSLYN